jgi:hypothetical protein
MVPQNIISSANSINYLKGFIGNRNRTIHLKIIINDAKKSTAITVTRLGGL